MQRSQVDLTAGGDPAQARRLAPRRGRSAGAALVSLAGGSTPLWAALLGVALATQTAGAQDAPGLREARRGFETRLTKRERSDAQLPAPPPELFSRVEDEDTRRQRRCEATFYAGALRQLRGERDDARRLLQACLDTQVTTYAEYASARAC